MEHSSHQGSSPLLSRHRSAVIHPTVVIDGEVEIAEDVWIGPHCVLTGPLRIEAGCQIGTGCIIGGAPEHRHLDSTGPVTIHRGTVLREYCIVHHGTTLSGTQIGSNCYIMNRVYIAHDCQIRDDVTISAGANIGGHVNIHRGANLGMQVTVHQHSTIGAFAMVGMSTPVCKDVPPLSLVAGNPIRLLRVNQHALDRLQLDHATIQINETGLTYARNDKQIESMMAEFAQDSIRQRLFEIGDGSVSTVRKPR